MRRGAKSQSFIALFLLGCLLFDYPVLYLFGGFTTILGVPILYLYLFSSWAVLIGLAALIAER